MIVLGSLNSGVSHWLLSCMRMYLPSPERRLGVQASPLFPCHLLHLRFGWWCRRLGLILHDLFNGSFIVICSGCARRFGCVCVLLRGCLRFSCRLFDGSWLIIRNLFGNSLEEVDGEGRGESGMLVSVISIEWLESSWKLIKDVHQC